MKGDIKLSVDIIILVIDAILEVYGDKTDRYVQIIVEVFTFHIIDHNDIDARPPTETSGTCIQYTGIKLYCIFVYNIITKGYLKLYQLLIVIRLYFITIII